MNAFCPHCLKELPETYVVVRRWKHALSPGLVRSLQKFAQAVFEYGTNDLNLSRDLVAPHLKLTHNEHANFQKLRFFALVAKVRSEDGSHIAGRWLLTRRGARFLKGIEAVSQYVFTENNRVVGHSDDQVMIGSYSGKVPEFQSKFDWDISEAGSFISPAVQSRFDL